MLGPLHRCPRCGCEQVPLGGGPATFGVPLLAIVLVALRAKKDWPTRRSADEVWKCPSCGVALRYVKDRPATHTCTLVGLGTLIGLLTFVEVRLGGTPVWYVCIIGTVLLLGMLLTKLFRRNHVEEVKTQ